MIFSDMKFWKVNACMLGKLASLRYYHNVKTGLYNLFTG